MRVLFLRACIPVLLTVISPLVAEAQIHYSNDFDTPEIFGIGISGSLTGGSAVGSVQGYSAYSPAFSGNFLRSIEPGNPAPAVTLSLAGLPPNEAVILHFALAIIDSWDGSSFPPDPTQAPDLFTVRINGTSEFAETFTNLSFVGATQSFAGPALAQEVQLGFQGGGGRLDSAYEINIATSADASGDIVVEFFASGSGWFQAPPESGPEEESWAIDSVSVTSPASPAPALGAVGTFLLALFLFCVGMRALTHAKATL